MLALNYPSPLHVENFFRRVWQVVPDPDDFEYIRAPKFQAEYYMDSGRLEGDCDDASTLAAAILASMGWPCVLIAIRRHGEPEFSHVWCRAIENGQHVDIDPIVPAEKMPIPDGEILDSMLMIV